MSIFSLSRIGVGVALILLATAANRADADLLVYEGFHMNEVELDGQGSGFGWGSPWRRIGGGLQPEAGFDVPQDGVSLDLSSYPVSPLGNRVVITGPGAGFGGEVRIARNLQTPFDLEEDGNTLFISFLFQKDVTGAPSNMEFNFGNATGSLANRVRLGSTSGDAFFLNAAGNQLGAITLGETYFLVMKVEAVAGAANNVWASVYGALDVVPSDEPISWGATSTFVDPASGVIDGVNLWMGINGAGQFDEIRMGTTWDSVTFEQVDLPQVPGDFNGDGAVDGSDFLMWQRGDSPDPQGTGDLSDWSDNFGTIDYGLFSGSPPAAVAAVPEAGSLATLLLGCACLAMWRRSSN